MRHESAAARHRHPDDDSLITVDDALRSTPSEHFDMVLTNPPFGKKSSYKVIGADGETKPRAMSYLRDDFWATTSTSSSTSSSMSDRLLTINGRAASLCPDNVLFEGGAGETVRRRLLEECDVHTLLRLPTGSSTPGRQGQRAVLRPQAAIGDAVDAEAVDLRSPHQPELHTEDPRSVRAQTSTTSSTATTPRTATSGRKPSGSGPSPTTS